MPGESPCFIHIRYTSTRLVNPQANLQEQQAPLRCSQFNMAVSIDRLKLETGITELQLECRIDDNVLRRIAKEFDGWEKFVGSPGLKLSEAQKADVRDCVFLKGHEMGVVKALKFWSDEHPHKTIGDLVNVFMELDELVLAEKLCTTGELPHITLTLLLLTLIFL